MLDVAEIIFQTCKTYLIQQGKFLLMLFVIIAALMTYYFLALRGETPQTLVTVLLFSIVGMGGSYAVAWYGIRVNTYANARTAFASLRGKPWDVVNIPLRAGMSVGLFLISLELVMMVIILLFVPRNIVGYCFLGFAIGESLGASALRIAGGIFTKIADIGSDLMKIVFNVKEDDPRNPGVIADCTGDNAGDSVGPTADGFETYGVTGVALIAFITLAVPSDVEHPGQADRLDLRHALPDGLHVRRVLLHQPGDLGEDVRGQEGFRLRAAADPPHLDRVHPVHHHLVRHELAAPQRPQHGGAAADGSSFWTTLPTSGGSWPRSSAAAPWRPCSFPNSPRSSPAPTPSTCTRSSPRPAKAAPR